MTEKMNPFKDFCIETNSCNNFAPKFNDRYDFEISASQKQGSRKTHPDRVETLFLAIAENLFLILGDECKFLI